MDGNILLEISLLFKLYGERQNNVFFPTN